MADGAQTVKSIDARTVVSRDAPTVVSRDAPTVVYSEPWAYVNEKGIPMYMDPDCAPAPGVSIALFDACKPNASSPPWKQQLATGEPCDEYSSADYESDIVWGQGPSPPLNIHLPLTKADLAKLF
jgi:hypothetical protein